jgi:deoxyribodipyrimidine photolyase-like uncharacterized protein
MKSWRCGNCAYETHTREAEDKCPRCGMWLDFLLSCDECQAPLIDRPYGAKPLIYPHMRTTDERDLCETHLSEVLKESAALQVTTQ